MGEAGRQIAFKVRTASCNKTACVNSFGDEQLAVDMLADKILFETLQYSQVCEQACSEEVPEPLDMGGKGFSVAFDPLDGSSIVDTNFAVGTIFGVWPGADLKGITGREQAAAGMVVYGPRTVFCLALKDFPGCHEFLLLDDGTWQHVKETTQINEGKMFSPGNLRATQDNPEYSKLVDFWLKEKYTLRYTGGMVPDVFQIIVKEKGVFSNVTSPTTVAKLRVLLRRPAALGAGRSHHRVGPAHPDLLRLRRRGEALRGVHVRLRPALLRGQRLSLIFPRGRDARARPPRKPPLTYVFD
jgi:sedoheptulose-bisphosphatase